MQPCFDAPPQRLAAAGAAATGESMLSMVPD
jgi:hypothetical protein